MKNLMAAVFLLIASNVAWAGPNVAGTLIVHNTGAVLSDGLQQFCAIGTDPSDCSQTNPRVDLESAAYPVIFRVYAAFPLSRAPRLMGVTWGINYDPTKLALPDYSNCADFQLPDSDTWPGPGVGTTLTWNMVQTGHVVRMYSFCAYTYSQIPCSFVLTPNPTQGGYFGDDSVPAVLDPIEAYSTLGFHTDGVLNCPPELPVGACCAPDHTCTYGLQSDCQAPSVWQGDWTVCDPNPCGVPPVGACCAVDGSCTLVVQTNCYSPSVWHGEWTNCWSNPCPLPPTGACCQPDGSCTLATEFHCTGSWLGSATVCAPNPCPQRSGACCFADGSCLFLTDVRCTALCRGYGTTCDPSPCAQPSLPGACCLRPSGCDVRTDLGCAIVSGLFQGEGTSCDPEPCIGLAACCTPTGTCFVRTPANCQPPDIWHGEYSDCILGSCPQGPPVGACCASTGACIVIMWVDCISPSIWHSEWQDCAPNRCPQIPVAACCAPGGACELTTEAACLPPNIWQPGLGNCWPVNPCPTEPLGVCCWPNGMCTLAPQTACAPPNTWFGNYSSCDSFGCVVPTPVRRTTWGRIKASYR